MAANDLEKVEVSESLLSQAMKEHQYENDDLQLFFLETENNTKLLLESRPNEITQDCSLNVETFKTDLKHTIKLCSEPDKIGYQLLKALRKSIKLS